MSPEAEDSGDVSQALQARLRSAIELDFVDIAPPTAITRDGVSAPGTEVAEDETFAFKLFATLPTSKASDAASLTTPGPTDAAVPSAKSSNNNEANAVQYISLKDEPVNYTLPTRRLSYYIAEPASAVSAARFATSALSTADVLRISKAPRPGLACPWRVINTPAVHARSLRGSSRQNLASSNSDTSRSATGVARRGGRKRLGKKSRIKLRKGLAAREVEEKEKLAASVRKEEQIREKKTRMNRAKQARKREKAKMKGEGGGERGGDEGEGS